MNIDCKRDSKIINKYTIRMHTHTHTHTHTFNIYIYIYIYINNNKNNTNIDCMRDSKIMIGRNLL